MIEYSLEEIQKNLLEKNPKNFYEISWAVRNKIVQDFILNKPACSLSEIIECIEEFEVQYMIRVDTIQSEKDSPIGEKTFFTGGVSIEKDKDVAPRPEGVEFISRSSVHCKIIQHMISEGAYGPFDAIIELGAGYGANIFRLRESDLSAPRYVAGEITNAGRELCDAMAKVPPLKRFTSITVRRI